MTSDTPVGLQAAELKGKPKAVGRETLALLFEEHAVKLYKLAFRMCGNHEDAEDVVQQTYLRAHESINDFREEGSLYTWLYTIAKNQCLRLLENRKKSSFSVMEKLITQAKTEETANGFSDVEKQYYINQVKDGCLLGLLRCLPFNQRMAFILCVLLCIKGKHAAAILGKSENAVRVLTHRAKRSLKAFLCQNCSLYDAHNPCRCENLIHFSLKHGWIHKAEGNFGKQAMNIGVSEIEKEINDLKRVKVLFDSLEDRADTEEAIREIREKIGGQSYRILSDKK